MMLLAMLAVVSGAVVNRPVVNMYSGPSEDKDVVSQAIYAAAVGVIEDRGEWTRIQTADDYSGWVQSAVLARRPYQGSLEVRNLFAHVCREPSVTAHAPLITIPFESRLQRREEEQSRPGWTAVALVDGRPGWVQAGDVQEGAARASIPGIIEFAKRFLGLPYTWGGTSSYGYDCSGFAQMLCRRRGYNLPRDAQPQANWPGMQTVSKDELRPGDLLYFGLSESNITHTAMYIGDGEFIHATTHDRPVIQISNLSEPHWTGLLVACRRIK